MNAKQVWEYVIYTPVTKENEAELIKGIIQLLPRKDFDVLRLHRKLLLLLATQSSTKRLFGSHYSISEFDLKAWSDLEDPAVYLFNLYLRHSLNTSIHVERACISILEYVLTEGYRSSLFHCRKDDSRNLLVSILVQWQRNGGLWHICNHGIEWLLQVYSRELTEVASKEFGDLGHSSDCSDTFRRDFPHCPGFDSIHCFYERYPYPRWEHLDTQLSTSGLKDHLLSTVNESAARIIVDEPKRILVLGCGTGREALHWATAFPNATVDGVDLSASSLSYAFRMAQHFGITNVNWFQNDLLHLPSRFADYDMVSAVGVLHHLHDPWEGVRIASQALHSDGVMHFALYSRLARKPVQRAREIMQMKISDFRVNSALAESRNHLVQCLDQETELRCLLSVLDFYHIDGCRDLFFNPRESCFDLLDISSQLARLNINFLGFELGSQLVLDKYRALFPTDLNCDRLEFWSHFEGLYPQTFLGMYRFWCNLLPVG